jgi:hypothetical protein
LRDSVDDEQLVGGENEVGAIPSPDGREPMQGRCREEQSADEPQRGRCEEHEDPAHEGEESRPPQRTRKRGRMRPLLESHLLTRLQIPEHPE